MKAGFGSVGVSLTCTILRCRMPVPPDVRRQLVRFFGVEARCLQPSSVCHDGEIVSSRRFRAGFEEKRSDDVVQGVD